MDARDPRTPSKADAPSKGAHFAVAPGTAGASGRAPATTGALDKKIHPLLKVYGVLALLGGVATLTVFVLTLISLVTRLADGEGTGAGPLSTSSIVINAVGFVLSVILAAMYTVLGVRLLRNKRTGASALAYTMIALVLGNGMCSVMLDGLGGNLVMSLVNLVVLLIISTYVDPALAQERELQRRLRDMEVRDAAEEGTLGRDETGRGYITLNFFNLFWIFMVASVLGLFIETVYRFVVAGVLEDRAGLLFGSFSPIYGVGAVLLTIALNRFYNRNALLIFIVAAVIGGVFEYFVSWFMEASFGITAWDYSGPWFNEDGGVNPVSFMNVNGRTSLLFMAFWGLLGLVWVRAALPRMLKVINLIPWNLRYAVTALTAAIMFLNCALTLVALDRWYERTAGNDAVEPVEMFCDEHFDDAFMAARFQTMSIDPSNAARGA